ncbi:hypothetical protein TNCV_4704121 [Trichonephila clavipes]|nr:hypothetical protein TNCV_4704121 [Trichonephila clavipes]
MELEGGKCSPAPALMVSVATAHKTFGPTDLTSPYSVCTRRVFGGNEHRTQARYLESDALTTSSKYIIAADSDDENKMKNAAPVPTSSKMRNIMKYLRSYLDAHSSGEMNNKMNDIEQNVDNLTLDNGEKISGYFPKTQ